MTEPNQPPQQPPAQDDGTRNGGMSGPPPEGPPAQDGGFGGSRYLTKSAADALRDQFGMTNMDPHLQEMLKAAKVRKDKQGLIVDFPGGHSSILASNSGIGLADNSKPVDEQAAETMAAMAKARGWDSVGINAKTPAERDLLWIAAQREGIKVTNYEPAPDSDVAKTWKQEQAGHKVSEAQPAPEGNPQLDTLKLLQEKIAKADDPSVRTGLKNVFARVQNDGLVNDPQTFDAVKQALGNENAREGFNQMVGVLNKANPGLNFPALGDASPAAAAAAPQTRGPSRTGAAMNS